jgi:hypothetical protein
MKEDHERRSTDLEHYRIVVYMARNLLTRRVKLCC